jgi:hypothetical protein
MSKLLEVWLDRATRNLSAPSKDRVRAEIQAHYESAREEGLAGAVSAEDADRRAVALLGDAAEANREYRKVLLTSAEVALLRETRCGVWAASWRWLWVLPLVVMIFGIRSLATGDAYFGWMLLLGAVGMGALVAAPRLPVYTPVRGRVFRVFRMLWLAAMLMLALKGSWLMLPVAWPLLWTEWRLYSLRRKLPVGEWPKQLYL